MKCVFVILTIVAICFCTSPYSNASNESWEQYFYISEEEQELFIKDTEAPLLWEIIKQDIAPHNAEMDLSRAFVVYLVGDTHPEHYESLLDDTNFEGFPYYFCADSSRYVIIPAFADSIPKVGVSFWNVYPGKKELFTKEEEETLGGGPICLYTYKNEYDGTLFWGTVFDGDNEINLIYKGAETAYNTVKNTGATINNIRLVCYYKKMIRNYYYLITVEEEFGGYIYDCTRNELITFEDFAEKLRSGSWPPVTPAPTRTPFWTPRPSSTSSISAPNTQTIATPTLSKTETATPSAGETAAPALTATAALFPSSSSAPEESAGSTVLIVIGAALVIAAAGAAGWAAFRKKKGGE